MSPAPTDGSVGTGLVERSPKPGPAQQSPVGNSSLRRLWLENPKRTDEIGNRRQRLVQTTASADSMAISLPAPKATPIPACMKAGVVDAVADHRYSRSFALALA